jgi:hypothetical protein
VRKELIAPAIAVMRLISKLEKVDRFRNKENLFFKNLYHQKYIPHDITVPKRAELNPLYKDRNPSVFKIYKNIFESD